MKVNALLRKVVILSLLLAVALVVGAEQVATIRANSTAVALAQEHANFLSSLLAAYLVFLCRSALSRWSLAIPVLKVR